MEAKVKIPPARADFPGPIPAHYNANILPPLIVLVHLRNRFEDAGDEAKAEKCRKAIRNFRTERPDWDDFV